MNEELQPNGMFADREDLKTAFDYALDVVKRGDPSMDIYGTTAIMVIWNTLANKYNINKKK